MADTLNWLLEAEALRKECAKLRAENAEVNARNKTGTLEYLITALLHSGAEVSFRRSADSYECTVHTPRGHRHHLGESVRHALARALEGVK